MLLPVISMNIKIYIQLHFDFHLIIFVSLLTIATTIYNKI